jgi:ADP-heptose:LPS heptosyltransferase
LGKSGHAVKLETTRKIDHHAGVVVCFLLTRWRRVVEFLWPRRALPPIRRVVFIKFAEQGATVLANGVLRRACSLVGPENVFFVCFQKNREILDILDVVPRANILTVRDDSLRHFAAGVLRSLWRLRSEKVDTTIDMELFARVSAIYAFLSGARRRVGLHKGAYEGLYRGDLLTHRVQYNPYQHMALHYDVLLAAAQRDPEESPLPKYVPGELPHLLPAFQPDARDAARITQVLAQAGMPEEASPLIVVNPKVGDIMPIRRWEDARFVELCQRLLGNYPQGCILLPGLVEEVEGVKRLCDAIGHARAINIAGQLNLRQFIGLLGRCDVLITTDSGPAHFAALTGIDIVVLFGSETPLLYGPLGDRAHTVYAGIACSPCLSAANMRVSLCQDNQCMKLITVDTVYEAAVAALEARRASGGAHGGD